MRRSEFEHILRATIANDPDIVVIGSQSILGSFSEKELPDAAHASIEADVAFFNDPENDKSDLVDVMIGEDSQFHVTHGYYAQGVDITTATLPVGWRERVVRYSSEDSEGPIGHCLDPHDLVVSKLVAFREKDLEFAGALLKAGLVDAGTLLSRAQTLDVPAKRVMVVGWLTAWIRKYG